MHNYNQYQNQNQTTFVREGRNTAYESIEKISNDVKMNNWQQRKDINVKP